ncbi:MAG: hypothetical protein QOG12_1322, partial [Verrucomicrobiota bacterium]
HRGQDENALKTIAENKDADVEESDRRAGVGAQRNRGPLLGHTLPDQNTDDGGGRDG